MFKLIAAGFVALSVLAAPALAQTTKDGKPLAKIARAECKTAAEAKGLKGKEKKASISTCFREKRPDLAKAGDCRKEGKTKGLEDKALRDFVKTCRTA